MAVSPCSDPHKRLPETAPTPPTADARGTATGIGTGTGTGTDTGTGTGERRCTVKVYRSMTVFVSGVLATTVQHQVYKDARISVGVSPHAVH